jgi:hypothetical protein
MISADHAAARALNQHAAFWVSTALVSFGRSYPRFSCLLAAGLK